MEKIFDFYNYYGNDSLTLFGIVGISIIASIGILILVGFLFHYYIIKEMRILNNKINNLTDVIAHLNRTNPPHNDSEK